MNNHINLESSVLAYQRIFHTVIGIFDGNRVRFKGIRIIKPDYLNPIRIFLVIETNRTCKNSIFSFVLIIPEIFKIGRPKTTTAKSKIGEFCVYIDFLSGT